MLLLAVVLEFPVQLQYIFPFFQCLIQLHTCSVKESEKKFRHLNPVYLFLFIYLKFSTAYMFLLEKTNWWCNIFPKPAFSINVTFWVINTADKQNMQLSFLVKVQVGQSHLLGSVKCPLCGLKTFSLAGRFLRYAKIWASEWNHH